MSRTRGAGRERNLVGAYLISSDDTDNLETLGTGHLLARFLGTLSVEAGYISGINYLWMSGCLSRFITAPCALPGDCEIEPDSNEVKAAYLDFSRTVLARPTEEGGYRLIGKQQLKQY